LQGTRSQDASIFRLDASIFRQDASIFRLYLLIFTVKLNLFNATLILSHLPGQLLTASWSLAATPAFRDRVQSKSPLQGLAHDMHIHTETLTKRMPLLTLLLSTRKLR
jgi:hypothetical protein